jgi:hypothetical protein
VLQSKSHVQPLGYAANDDANWLKRSIASRTRSVGAVTEIRTYPSPAGPKNEPGATETPACSNNASANSSDDTHPDGARTQA